MNTCKADKETLSRSIVLAFKESVSKQCIFKSKAGFTFIELFIAVSVFAVVAIALYSTFFAGIAVWRRSGEGGNIYQDIRFVFDDMSRDLKNAVYCTDDEDSMYVFQGKKEEIVLITLEPDFSEEDASKRRLVKVFYGFERDTNRLIRGNAGISSGFDIEKSEKEVLLDNVEEFAFEYCYDSGDEDDPYLWEDEWEDEDMRIPRGVRIISSIKPEEDRDKALEFTKTIFIPTGVLGEEEL